MTRGSNPAGSRGQRAAPFLLAVLCLGGLLAPAARADEASLQQELDSLKQRLEAVEKELAKEKAAKEAATTKPRQADEVKAKAGSRLLFGGFAQVRATNIANEPMD